MGTMATRWLARRLKHALVHGTAARRPPDFVIGDRDAPYMLRWWILPRNRAFNIYLHQFLRDDDDRALHDHPFWSVSLALDGDLTEVYLKGGAERVRAVSVGDAIVRSGKFAHRMLVPRPSWTLFVTGPVYRQWGFLCPDIGWRHWKVFTAPGAKGQVGRGCGE